MFNAENLQEKWAPVLNHDGLPEIKDNYRKAVTAILLENQEKQLREERAILTEAPTNVGPINTQTTGTGAVDGFDPILISLIRRAMPKLIAYDIAGVQPMNGPTGLIFAMRSHYTNQTGNEAFFNEPDAQFSGTDGGTPPTATTENNPALINDATGGGTTEGNYDLASSKFSTSEMEALGDGTNTAFMEMAFSIDRIAVEAKGRALRADYSVELAQDLKAIHGLDAESELANILSTEILAEINREVVRTVYRGAKPGAQTNVANQGVFDLDLDSNGRWSVEKFKGLLFQIERDANAIAQETRRGKGNVIITSADVKLLHLPWQVYLTTAAASTVLLAVWVKLMTLATPLLVLSTVASRSTSTHILQTYPLTNTTLLVTRAPMLMTLVCSIAHMYLSRCTEQSVRTPSSHVSDLRHATAWS